MSKRRWKHSRISIIETFISDEFDDADWVTVRVSEIKDILYSIGDKIKTYYRKYYKEKYEKFEKNN